MKLKDGKVPGNDGFTTEFLKKLASGISEPLAMIYNKSLLEGVVPHEWKQANITPLFKKGSKSEPGNYRPVSLTSYLGKILEAILNVNIMHHITVNSLINASQHGFLSRRSCLTNLLEFLEFVTSAVEQNKTVDVICLDFQKAFDKVPHVRLLRKVESHGICGSILKRTGEWLPASQQRVVLNRYESAWLYVISGVPQGSVLGPLLFLLFINDIDNGVVNKLLKFADDTKLVGIVSSESEVEQLRLDLKRLYDWSLDWQMLFIIGKCKSLHFGYSYAKSTYKLGGDIVKVEDEEKDLGIVVTRALKSSSQCAAAAKSANKTLGMISRMFVNRDK